MAWAFSGFTFGSLERAVTEDSALKQACPSCHVKEKGELIGGVRGRAVQNRRN